MFLIYSTHASEILGIRSSSASSATFIYAIILKTFILIFLYTYIYCLSNTFLSVLSKQEVHSLEGELAQKEGFSWIMF